MELEPGSFTYAVEQRLRFIDFLLDQYGHINRSALMDYYGISTPQASKDISDYLTAAPGNATYNPRSKAYERSTTFTRVW